MTNEPNKICEETNLQKIGNLIIIPYYDLIEEPKSNPPLYINGFSITELDETNEDLYQDEDIPDIETKKGFHLKKKAESIENYYMNYSNEELSNVHCSKCYLNGFSQNELLYFKDRKSLISYLKYCFIFLKKNLFMDHSIYMNNRYDLFKIDQTYLIGFRFFIPKTICKSCFIQLINKEFLLSKIKNEISDYDNGFNSSFFSPKKDLNLLRKKRNRKEKKIKNSEKKETKEKNKEKNKLDEDSALKSIQISPIVIPLSNNDTPKKKPKRKKLGKFGIKRRKRKIVLKPNMNKNLNENVFCDITNNRIIINKKILKDINININEEKKDDTNTNKTKSNNNSGIKEKEKEKDKEKIFIAKKQDEVKKISNNYESVKCINLNINKENSDNNKEKIKKEKKEKNANKTNNSNGIREINLNKKGLNQINNNTNNNIYLTQQIYPNYFWNPQSLFQDLLYITIHLKNIFDLAYFILQNMEQNPKISLENFKIHAYVISILIEDIGHRINENRILMEYSFLATKKNMEIFHQKTKLKEMELNYRNLYQLHSIAYKKQDNYNQLWKLCTEGWDKIKNKFGEGNNCI